MKCIAFIKAQFKYHLVNPTIDYISAWCNLPFSNLDSLMYQDKEEKLLNQVKVSTILAGDASMNDYANIFSLNENAINQSLLVVPDIVIARQKNSRGLMMCHLNVNS